MIHIGMPSLHLTAINNEAYFIIAYVLIHFIKIYLFSALLELTHSYTNLTLLVRSH